MGKIESQGLNGDKIYFLPVDFPAPRYGTIDDNKILEDENLDFTPTYKLIIDGVNCAIYTDRLNWFLQSKVVKVADIADGYETINIDGTNYRKSYKNGYEAGVNHFNEKYRLNINTMYLSMDKYIETLQGITFEGCKESLWEPGLEGVKFSHLGSFNHQILWEHGYFAGMYSQIEELMNNYKPIKLALLSKKKTVINYLDKPKSKFEQVLEQIDRKISGHVFYSFYQKEFPARYTPLNEYWNTVPNNDKSVIVGDYINSIVEFVHRATELANAWYDEKQQAVILQPDRADELWAEYRNYYVDRIKDTYQPIRSWYTSHWNVNKLCLKNSSELEQEIFIFCYDQSLPFEHGLHLLANLYGCYFAVNLFNTELEKLKVTEPTNVINKKSKQALPPNDAKPKILILSPLQTRLLKTLVDYIPPDQLHDFELLLNNGFSENRVWAKLRADSLVYIFKQARELVSSPILADMTETANWIAAYFNWGKNAPRPVSKNTAYNVLRGNVLVKKANQIRLKL